MGELVVFGAANSAEIENYFEAGADRYFITLSGDFKCELHTLRATGLLQDDGRVGVAQLEWVDGPTLAQCLPDDWRISCVISDFFSPHEGKCDVMALPAGWEDPGNLATINANYVRGRKACRIYSILGGDVIPHIDGYYRGLRELVRESNEHPELEQMDETDFRTLVSLGSVSIGGNLAPRDFQWLASTLPSTSTGLFWICDDVFAIGKPLHPMYVTHPKSHILEMLKCARIAGFGGCPE